MSKGISRRRFLAAGARAGAALGLGSLAGCWPRGTGRRDGAAAAARVDPAALGGLRDSLHGRLLTPADAEYEAARRIWNFRFDPHPIAIARCADAADVARAIEFARRRQLPATIRSGGHSQAGYTAGDGALVVDLGAMKRVEIDEVRRIARAGPGLTRLELETALQERGLVTAMGQCADVGIGGLTLGGGEGVLAGRYGAVCDNVVAAEVVTADGRVLRASAEENPDLLWGVCGGAGNLGAVTALEYRLYPLREVVAGWLRWPVTRAHDVLRSYRDFARSAPDELWTEVAVSRFDGDEPSLGIFVFHSGDPKRAERDVARLRSFARPAADTIVRRSYLDGQAAAGFPVAWGLSSYQRSGFLPELTDELLAALVAEQPPKEADVWLAHLHGAISRRPPDHNVYPIRRPGFTLWFEADWEGAAEPRAAIAWVDRMWALAQPLTRGVYVNMLDVEPEERTRAAFGPNYARLAALKRRYDPENFFRMNANVRPA
ncbi:MAG TPA: FAD-binding oxidoreductase [Candidatus Binatia bacterium]|nr:FAD-binding oxidoreductase [Candidatus Binatia bacterium]